ncbi:MAG: integrase [Nanoarchaeota archaeon]
MDINNLSVFKGNGEEIDGKRFSDNYDDYISLYNSNNFNNNLKHNKSYKYLLLKKYYKLLRKYSDTLIKNWKLEGVSENFIKRCGKISQYLINLTKRVKDEEEFINYLYKKSKYYYLFFRKSVNTFFKLDLLNEKEKEILLEFSTLIGKKMNERLNNFGKLEEIKKININEVIELLNLFKKENKELWLLLSKILLESGIRGTELLNLLKNKENLKKSIIYSNNEYSILFTNFLRKTKKNFYVILFNKTLDELLDLNLNVRYENLINRFKEELYNNNFAIKYFRKVNYNIWAIELENPKVGDIVQGRISDKNVSDYFYLSNLELIKKHYPKFYDYVNRNVYSKLK